MISLYSQAGGPKQTKTWLLTLGQMSAGLPHCMGSFQGSVGWGPAHVFSWALIFYILQKQEFCIFLKEGPPNCTSFRPHEAQINPCTNGFQPYNEITFLSSIFTTKMTVQAYLTRFF